MNDAKTESNEPAAAAPVDEGFAPWKPIPPKIHKLQDAEAVAEAAAERFASMAKSSIQLHDRFLVVLAGGSTPRGLYRKLTEPPYKDAIPWDQVYFLFGDERCVPPDHEDSNYNMARELLFEPLEISETQIFRLKGEQAPADAAKRYEVRLGDLFLIQPKRKFDLVILGIGTDGHTASLFPGTRALDEEQRWVVPNEVPKLGQTRLTMTYPALNSARRVMFLATGKAKAQVIAEAFGGVEHVETHPVERIVPQGGRRDVMIDAEAASELP